MQDPRIPKKVLTHNNVRPPYELVKPLWRLTEAQDVEAYSRWAGRMYAPPAGEVRTGKTFAIHGVLNSV